MWDWTYTQGTQQNANNASSALGNAPTAKGAVVMAMQTHSKSEVVVVKALPVRNPIPATQFPDQHRIRFVSVCADGQALVWDIPALREGFTPLPSGDLASSSVLPVARLRDNLGPGLTRQSVTFDAETSILHTCSNERRIRLWDIEEIYTGKRGSMNASMHGAGGMGGSMHGSIQGSVHGGVGASTHGISPTKGIGGLRPSLTKRSSIASISSLITGSVDPLATVPSLKTLGALAPHKSLAASYGKMTSVGVVHHPYFTSGCYVVNSRANTFAILQDKGSTGVNDEVDSTGSSSTSGSNEKAAPLVLLQEFALNTLLERYLVEKSAVLETFLMPTLSDALRAEAVDAKQLHIVAVLPHPAVPSLYAVLSSVGLVMVSLGRSPSGSMYGSHPGWGSVRMAFANDYSVQKVLLAAPESEDGESAAPEEPVVGEVWPEVLEDNVAPEQLVAAGHASAPAAASTSSSFSLMRKSRKLTLGSGETKSSCRPVFHASPSGTYCAVHWPESMVYVILRVNVAFAAVVKVGKVAVPAEETARPVDNQSAQEVDRGVCLEFGWIGTDDYYLIKTPAEIISRAAAMKNKRGSVSGMFSSARKESSMLLAPQLVLKQCVSQAPPGAGKTTTKIVEHVLQLPSSATSKGSSAGARETPHLSASTVVHLFGGPVLNINTLNAKEAEAVLSAAALAKRQADAHAAAAAAAEGKPRGPAGPPVPAAEVEDDGSRMIDDVEATTRELRAAQPPAASKQISTFYTLVSAKWLKAKLANEAAAAANALAAKDKTQKKTKKATSAATDGASNEVEESSHGGGGDAALQLIAVGPAMQSAEIVRWDFQHDLCAVVLAGSSAINILRLSVLSGEESSPYPQLDLHTLQSVDFCIPRSLRVSPLCGLTWTNGVLFATEESSASVNAIYCSHASGAKVPASYPAIYSANVFEMPNFSPYLSVFHAASLLNKFNAVPVYNPVPVSEVLGLQQNTVYTASRDGTVFGVPLSVGAPQSAVALLSSRVSASNTTNGAGLPLQPSAHACNWLEALAQ
eukprot:gene18812-21407_t